MTEEGIMGGDAHVPAAAEKIIRLVREFSGGITRAELTTAARGRYPGLPEARLGKLVGQAVTAGLLSEADGRLTVPAAPAGQVAVESAEEEASECRGGLRGRAPDVGRGVRPVSRGPF